MISRFSGPYRRLSNFWSVDIIFDGITYPSVEHAYQASKTLNLQMRRIICNAITAGSAKRLGRKCKLRPAWESMKVNVMRELLVEKFRDNDLRMELLDTGDQELIEGNNWSDTFWGVCNGVGENMLGKLLMEVRQEIRDGI